MPLSAPATITAPCTACVCRADSYADASLYLKCMLHGLVRLHTHSSVADAANLVDRLSLVLGTCAHSGAIETLVNTNCR